MPKSFCWVCLQKLQDGFRTPPPKTTQNAPPKQCWLEDTPCLLKWYLFRGLSILFGGVTLVVASPSTSKAWLRTRKCSEVGEVPHTLHKVYLRNRRRIHQDLYNPTVDGRNPANQLIGSLCHFLQCLILLRWCRISAINSKYCCSFVLKHSIKKISSAVPCCLVQLDDILITPIYIHRVDWD